MKQILRFRWAVIVLSLIFTVILGLGIPKLKNDTDPAKMASTTEKTYMYNEESFLRGNKAKIII